MAIIVSIVSRMLGKLFGLHMTLLALKKELQRLNLSVVDNDHELRQRFAHLSSQKRGDLAI